MAEAEFNAEDLTMTVDGEAPLSDSTQEGTPGVEDSPDGLDWGNLADDFSGANEENEPAQLTRETPEKEAEAPQPKPSEPEGKTPTPEPPVEAPAPAPETPPVAEAPAPETPAKEQAQPEQPPKQESVQLSDEQLQTMRQQYTDKLVQQYKLSDEDASNLVTDANSVLPNLAASLHANIVQEMTTWMAQTMQSIVPQMMDQFTRQRESQQRGEEVFYGQWPELKDHADRVKQIATTYRQLNPSVQREQFVRDVGVQAWLALGLDAAKLAGKLTPAAAAPAARQKPRPPTPANPGGARDTSPPPPENPFSALAREFEEDFD